VKNKDKVDGPDADKSEWIKLEFLMDPDNSASGSKYSQWMQVPEDWIKWVMAFRDIENLMPMKKPTDKTRMFRTLLRGQSLSYLDIILGGYLRQKAQRSLTMNS
jgi:negative regulator of genetic competence, sporulation and motility